MKKNVKKSHLNGKYNQYGSVFIFISFWTIMEKKRKIYIYTKKLDHKAFLCNYYLD